MKFYLTFIHVAQKQKQKINRLKQNVTKHKRKCDKEVIEDYKKECLGKKVVHVDLKNLYAKHRGQKPGIKIADDFNKTGAEKACLFLMNIMDTEIISSKNVKF